MDSQASESSSLDDRFAVEASLENGVYAFLKGNIMSILQKLKIDDSDKRFQASDPPERRVMIDFIPFNSIACWRPVVTNMNNAYRTAISEAMALANALENTQACLISSNFLYDLRSFSLRLYDIGFKSESLQICRFEKDILEARAKEIPKIFNAHYAAALHRFSGRLWDQKFSKEALKAAEQSIAIFRSLSDDTAIAHNSGLASSLQLAATCLDDLGNFMDAIPMFEECIKIHRELLSNTSQKIYRYPTLAVALLGLSNATYKSQCSSKAFENANEALNLLQNKDPDVTPIFDDTPFIARAYAYVAQAQISLDDKDGHENALKCAKEAVSLARRLSDSRPQIFNHDLATYLCILAQCEIKQKTSTSETDALKSAGDAVSLHKDLVAAHPGKFELFLVRSLTAHADIRCRSKPNLAILKLWEAERIIDEFSSEFLGLLHLELANCFGKLSNCLESQGESSSALRYSQKALQIYRFASEKNPRLLYNLFQEHLKVHVRICTTLLQNEEALKCIKGAIANYRSYQNNACDTELAFLLLKKLYLLKDLKQWSSVLETGNEAIDTITSLTTPSAYYTKKIANISHWCGYAAYMIGKYEDATTILEKTVENRRSASLAGDNIEESKQLANAYSLLGESLTRSENKGISRYEEAADVFLQALQIRRNLLQEHSETVQKQQLVRDLVMLSSAYYESGRLLCNIEESRSWYLLGKALENAMEAWSFAKENPASVDHDTAESAKAQEKKCLAKIRSMSGIGIQKLNKECFGGMDVYE